MERGKEGICALPGSSNRKLYDDSKASARESKEEASERLLSSLLSFALAESWEEASDSGSA